MPIEDTGAAGRPPASSSEVRNLRRWAEYLVAILGGNILFLLLEPHLPAPLRHRAFRIDWGLGLDFVLCLALYGLIRLGRGRRPLLKK